MAEMKSTTTIIILIHGGALSSKMYRTLIPILRDHPFDYEHIITPDLPAHGSQKDKLPFTFTKATADIHKLLCEVKRKHPQQKVLLVGTSLGGQVVLDVLSHYPNDVDAALVSGVTIAPPDENAAWEMPHMPPTDSDWLRVIMEDVEIIGMEEAGRVQEQSLSFTFRPDGKRPLPPVLVVRGENDVVMVKRDFDSLVGVVMQAAAQGSRGLVMLGTWHNHSIDVPEQFAQVIHDWIQEVL